MVIKFRITPVHGYCIPKVHTLNRLVLGGVARLKIDLIFNLSPATNDGGKEKLILQ